ncbi:MAG: NAD(P)-dependent glycerol-3-phosphate dehydrogenase [Ruminococcaceae bacterium]|nr:NAD(P)-dependent glycerol-3-phosphate dehydrogenase [Oscillospiraceae bacterium]
MAKIGVLGAGTWGIALAKMLSENGHEVTVWSAVQKELDALTETHRHPNLSGVTIPAEIVYTPSVEEACVGKDVVMFSVASPYVRATAAKAAAFLTPAQVIVDVAKGIEADTLMTMSQIIEDELKKAQPQAAFRIVALSGPTHAEEVARDLPTAIVSSSKDDAAAKYVQEVFMNTCMRVYTNTDMLGVELCGALKNIMALAAGVSSGLGFGDNAKAALITRGMAEITRLGLAMGCSEQTFLGLAGIGDLIVTATSMHSRNNRCGYRIGQGIPVDQAVHEVGMVVEGIHAIPAAMRLAQQYNVEMPIVEMADAVVGGRVTPKEAVRQLMTRNKKPETR